MKLFYDRSILKLTVSLRLKCVGSFGVLVYWWGWLLGCLFGGGGCGLFGRLSLLVYTIRGWCAPSLG